MMRSDKRPFQKTERTKQLEKILLAYVRASSGSARYMCCGKCASMGGKAKALDRYLDSMLTVIKSRSCSVVVLFGLQVFYILFACFGACVFLCILFW